MKQLTKLSNLAIFGFALVLFFIIQPHQKFSLELSSMLTGEDKKFYDISEKFSYVKTFLVAVEGLENDDLKKLKKIKEELLANSEIEVNNQLNNKKYQEFKQKYKLYLNELNYKNGSEIKVNDKLKNIYVEMISSSFYYNINLNDPLEIINTDVKSQIKLKNGSLILGDFGYLSIFTITSKTDEKSRIKIYNEIEDILKKYDNVKAFSSIFFYVENSRIIQSDVKLIIMTSMVILGILYILILRNLYLFFNIAITLATSVIFGQIVVTYFFPQTSIIALVFSTAITSVSIDYMFHHYLHNYYNKQLGFNKSVFYGFITTITAFSLISFINFPLIEQISIFTIVSLFVAYVHFAFIYPHLGIKHKEPYSKENYKSPFIVRGHKIILFSLVIIIISLFYVNFDFNIKNLDYQNKKLIETEKFFKSNLNQNKKIAVLITGTTIDTIITNSKIIKKLDKNATVPLSSLLSQEQYIRRLQELQRIDFTKIKKDIKDSSVLVGFKETYFNNSYNNEFLYPPYPLYTQDMIKNYGFDLVLDDKQFITYAMVSPAKLDDILSLNFTQSAQSKVLFENSLKKVYNELLLFGGLTLLLIISILAIVTKRRFLQAFSYILFPASLILLYGWFVPLNIMHIFMGFVVLAIGIDYGIYMNEPTLSHNTTLAIIYSLISTFAGFGVLILSDINSLFSIGITAIIGVSGILFLLIFQKRIKKEHNKKRIN